MISRRLTDGLYVEAMLLADEVRAYFDASRSAGRDELAPLDRVLFSCESLKITTRLMHVIAWLLTQRAVDVGELPCDGARDPSRRLGESVESDPVTLARLPHEAQRFVEASIDLYRRVGHLDGAMNDDLPQASPARALYSRLQRSF